jgi:hypothetical protein
VTVCVAVSVDAGVLVFGDDASMGGDRDYTTPVATNGAEFVCRNSEGFGSRQVCIDRIHIRIDDNLIGRL